MTQYNTLNVTFPNSQLNKLKSGIKSITEVALNISSNVVGDSNDENDFAHKFLLTNVQGSRVCKSFADNWSANAKLSKNTVA